MLAIRLQRRGRSGHAQFRMIVQDARFSPKSEKIVAYLGSYDPHTKTTQIDKEQAEKYLANGAQPSNRVAKILQAEKVKLPDWVAIDTSFKGKLKNPEKLRKNQPDEPAEAEEPKAEATEEKSEKEAAKEADADKSAEEDNGDTSENQEQESEEKSEDQSEEKLQEAKEDKPDEDKPKDAKDEKADSADDK